MPRWLDDMGNPKTPARVISRALVSYRVSPDSAATTCTCLISSRLVTEPKSDRLEFGIISTELVDSIDKGNSLPRKANSMLLLNILFSRTTGNRTNTDLNEQGEMQNQ